MAADLERQARAFAASLQEALNGTICTGVRMTVGSSPSTQTAEIGYGLKSASHQTRLIPVAPGRQKPRCWLTVAYRLSSEETRRFLSVTASSVSVYSAPGECLCHFDYERNKPGGYPEAHVQVHGMSAALASWTGLPQTRELDRLHIPVGGRRFRPTLEDVIEFLIGEKLAGPRDGWARALADHRRNWERIQLSAAIRADPDTAWDVLSELRGGDSLRA